MMVEYERYSSCGIYVRSAAVALDDWNVRMLENGIRMRTTMQQCCRVAVALSMVLVWCQTAPENRHRK